MKIKTVFKRMIHYHYLLLFVAGFLMNQNVLAQDAKQITASGVILDANKEPLIGVSVVVDGTTNGTVTDFDGKFTLTCPEGSKLQVSYIGYKAQKIAASSTVSLVLQEDAKLLESVEIVGVGYGTMRKKDLTGAISSVSAGDMKQGVVTSSEQLLQGKIAGLTVIQGSGDPVSGASVRLRGGTSLSGMNAPLVVVDGVADVDMNTVQASDIASIDVLKDASACAIYGSRGANGVIIVTTNRQNKESRSAQYNAYVGIAKASSKLDLLDAQGWKDAGFAVETFDSNTDWQKEIQQTAISQSHALTFASSTEKGGFNGSLSYLNSEGVIKTSELERLAASVSGFTTVWKDRLRIESGVHTNHDDYTTIDYRNIFKNTYSISPVVPVMNPDGTYAQAYGLSDNVNLSLNPVEILNKNTNANSRTRLLVYSKADLDIVKGLKGTVNISYTNAGNQTRSYVYSDAMGYGTTVHGSAARGFSDFTAKQFESYFNYDNTFNTLHKLNLMVGYSYAGTMSEGFGAGASRFLLDDFMYNNFSAAAYREYLYSYKDETKLISAFGRANYIFASKYMFTATLRRDGSSKFGANNKWGTFPSASFAWRITDESFMQSTSEWLNNLKLRAGYGVTGNQGGIASYGSLRTYTPSLGDPLSDENDNPVLLPSGDKEREVILKQTRNPNDDLKWESTSQLNIGLDFTILNNKISGTLEGYHKLTSDLLYVYEVGVTLNVLPTTLMNIGNLTNTGVELTLNANILKTTDFTWDANINLAHNQNKITKITDARFKDTKFSAGTLIDFDALSTGNFTQQLKEGYAAGSFFGAKSAGLDPITKQIQYEKRDPITGEVTLVTTTSELSESDKNHYLGSAQPKLTMGFGMNFGYKKADLSVSTNGMFGQKVYNATAMDLNASRDGRNILASAVGQQQTNFVSDYWLEDASFLRIQSITLGYTFDLKKINMSSIRLYATVDNLFVFTNYSGVDPEVSIDMDVTNSVEANKKYPGIDAYNNYPKPRTYLFGLSLLF